MGRIAALTRNPVMIALTPMIVPVPIMTPSTVRNARSLCDRMGGN